MVKTKNRPTTNHHCLTGIGAGYWKSKAQGFGSAAVQNSASGYHVTTHNDAAALDRNGGIKRPVQCAFGPGTYYRFLSSRHVAEHGKESTAIGNWWIKRRELDFILRRHLGTGVPVSEIAKTCLAVLDHWSDCAYVARIKVEKELVAFRGGGGAALDEASVLDAGTSDLRGARGLPDHVQFTQYFVPGEREELVNYFRNIEVVRTTTLQRAIT